MITEASNPQRPSLPGPRRPHPIEQEASQEVSPTLAAGVGEVAAADPNQVRLKNIVNTVEAAVRARQEAGLDTGSEAYEFEYKTGEELRKSSDKAAQAAAELGITDDVEVTVLYNFAAKDPAGVELILMKQGQDEGYKVVKISEPLPEDESKTYSAKVETYGNSNIMPTAEKPHDVQTATDQEMEAYWRAAKAASQKGNPDDIDAESNDRLTNEWMTAAQKTRDLDPTEAEAIAVINQSILDLQPPLDQV